MWVVPTGMSHWTATPPSGEPSREKIALLARVRPALKLAEIASAFAGTPHWPATGKLRTLPDESAGPPHVPTGRRVSTSRQKAIVKYFRIVPAGITVTDALPGTDGQPAKSLSTTASSRIPGEPDVKA